MDCNTLDIEDAYLFDLKKTSDGRGSFSRVFCADTLLSHAKLDIPLKHINLSVTKQKGSVRGLRYQVAPALETKLVTCLRGRAYDVMVDLRKKSSTFMNVQVNEMDSRSPSTLIVPQGVAHGFQTLDDDTEILYMTTQPYNKECERSIRYDDPLFNIRWPLEVTNISEHDNSIAYLGKKFMGLDL